MLVRFHFPGVNLPVHHRMDRIPSPGDAFTLATLLYRVDRVAWEWPGGPPQVYLLGPIARVPVAPVSTTAVDSSAF